MGGAEQGADGRKEWVSSKRREGGRRKDGEVDSSERGYELSKRKTFLSERMGKRGTGTKPANTKGRGMLWWDTEMVV